MIVVKCPMPHERNRNGDIVPLASCSFCSGTGEVRQVEAVCRDCNGKTVALLGGGTALTPTGNQRTPVVAGRSHCCQAPLSVNMDVIDAFADTPIDDMFPYEQTPCPKCGKKTVMPGYGLAGGGFGPYWACDSCDYFHKEQDE